MTGFVMYVGSLSFHRLPVQSGAEKVLKIELDQKINEGMMESSFLKWFRRRQTSRHWNMYGNLGREAIFRARESGNVSQSSMLWRYCWILKRSPHNKEGRVTSGRDKYNVMSSVKSSRKCFVSLICIILKRQRRLE